MSVEWWLEGLEIEGLPKGFIGTGVQGQAPQRGSSRPGVSPASDSLRLLVDLGMHHG